MKLDIIRNHICLFRGIDFPRDVEEYPKVKELIKIGKSNDAYIFLYKCTYMSDLLLLILLSWKTWAGEYSMLKKSIFGN